MSRRKIAQALDSSVPAKKAPTPKAEPQPETLLVPAALLLAAESIAAKVDKERQNLQGVLLHQKDAGAARVVGCDGVRLFIGSFPVPSKPPSWLKTGLLLAREDLKAMLSMIVKVVGSEIVQVRYAKDSPTAILTDAGPTPTMSFMVQCGAVAEFPSYDGILQGASFANLTEEGEVKGTEWQPVGFNSMHLKHCGDIAKLLESAMPKQARAKNGMIVRVFDSGAPGTPRVFDFVGFPGAVLVVAAVQLADTALPLPTARILAPAVRGSVAALRAHATRWRDAAEAATDEDVKAAALEKAAGFDARMNAILGQGRIEGPKNGGEATHPESEAATTSDVEPPSAAQPEKAAASRRRKAERATVVH